MPTGNLGAYRPAWANGRVANRGYGAFGHGRRCSLTGIHYADYQHLHTLCELLAQRTGERHTLASALGSAIRHAIDVERAMVEHGGR
jgi:hypothetical protein